jgi:hypothetical protein
MQKKYYIQIFWYEFYKKIILEIRSGLLCNAVILHTVKFCAQDIAEKYQSYSIN